MEPKREVLDQLEREVMEELGIKRIGKDMTTHEAGMIGGYMVKKLIERGEMREERMGGQSEDEME